MSRAERWAPLVTGIALAIPTLLAHYLPMSDLPLHEGVVGILRHFGDASYFPPDLYELNIGQTNQLFYFLALGLSYLVGTTWAVKIVIAATQVGILVAGGRLSDHLGRSRWGALLLAPLALGYTYYWGLVANLLGFALFFAVIPLIDRASAKPTGSGLARVCAALFLLFLAHESIVVIALCFVLLLAVARPLELRASVLRFLPLPLTALFLYVYFGWSRRTMTGGQVVIPMTFPSLWEKTIYFPSSIFGSHDEFTRMLLFGLGVVALLALLVARVRSHEEVPASPAPPGSSPGRLGRAQELMLHYRFEVAAFGYLLAYAIAPATWTGATMVYERFVGPAWALCALAVAPRQEPSRLARLAVVGVPLGMLLLSWPQFVDSDRTYRNLDAIIAQIPKNSSVALASIDRPVYRTRVYSASTGPARVVADRGGRASISLVISPISPVQIRREYRWDELDRRLLMSGSRSLTPTNDLKRFGWVIAQSRDVSVREIIIRAFLPDAELVAAQGEWLLFRSTHEQLPLTSPNAPPDRNYETILQRVTYLVEQGKRQPPSPPPPATTP